jgi:DNA-binding transcriptional ArsR family regulator
MIERGRMTDAQPTRDAETGEHATSMLTTMRGAAQKAAEFLRSIGSTHRLMILCLLMDGAKTVTEICDAVGARQSLVSQHLTRLRLDGLVRAERQGHFVRYSMADTPAKEIVATLHRHFCPDGQGRPKN